MVLPETARRDPRRGEIPVMRIRCPQLSVFPVAGARRSIILQVPLCKSKNCTPRGRCTYLPDEHIRCQHALCFSEETALSGVVLCLFGAIFEPKFVCAPQIFDLNENVFLKRKTDLQGGILSILHPEFIWKLVWIPSAFFIAMILENKEVHIAENEWKKEERVGGLP